MRLPSSHTLRRPGFTLIEVLVAAGLCLLIMSVITVAFSAGLGTFSLLKSIGEANGRLALTEGILQSDLKEVHLEDDTGLPLKVSQVRYDLLNTQFAQDAFLGRYVRPPARGFFRVTQGSVSQTEGTDPDGNPSTFAFNHVLHMTVRRTPDVPARAFTARVPNPNPAQSPSDPLNAWNSDNKIGLGNTAEYVAPSALPGRQVGDFGYRLQHECLGGLSGTPIGTDRTFASPWAEVAYFLRLTPATTGGPTPRQLYSLHRKVRVLTKNDQALTQLSWNRGTMAAPFRNSHPGMSFAPGGGLNGPGDISNPSNRMGGLQSLQAATTAIGGTELGATPDPITGVMTGEDILLTNVISFEIKVAWDSGFSMITNPRIPQNLVNPLVVRPVGGGEQAPGTPPTPIVLTTAGPPTPTSMPPWVVTNDQHTPEPPYDDLPLVPSVTRGFTATDSSGTNQTFAQGSGNANFARWYANATYDATTTGLKRVFDTWAGFNNWNQPVVPDPNPMNVNQWLPNPNYVPLPIRVKSIQIKLRIYDPKNKLTRQVTIKQDV